MCVSFDNILGVGVYLAYYDMGLVVTHLTHWHVQANFISPAILWYVPKAYVSPELSMLISYMIGIETVENSAIAPCYKGG